MTWDLADTPYPCVVRALILATAIAAALGCSAAPSTPSGRGGSGGTAGGTPGGTGGASGGASGGAGGAPDPHATETCRACQLASSLPNCAPILLTATSTLHPETGEPVAVGWGLDTLPTPQLREAALALLRCINLHDCATNGANTGPGSNAALGCLGGLGTEPTAILAGTLLGPCAGQYKAAALADGLNQSGDTDAGFALSIARAAFDPTQAVGLPDTLVQCAVEAPCPTCGGI